MYIGFPTSEWTVFPVLRDDGDEDWEGFCMECRCRRPSFGDWLCRECRLRLEEAFYGDTRDSDQCSGW